ncbi:MAG: DNA methylase [Oscillospiraceae bacterium]|nr:DNA methylase [Oscillospiraceae bacterium]
MQEKTYIAIDLKSFYASVECVERGLDPLDANLVVADESRTEKTICLAVSPSLKAHGIPGRARLFEVTQKVRQVNAQRRKDAPGGVFTDKAYLASELAADPGKELGYIVAPPQMAHYMSVSAGIYDIYLRYIAPEDIHVYSVDEVFIDAGAYLKTYGLSPRELAMMLIHAVLKETGITATAGIGTNLYLAKIAMDIDAKHIKADKDGVRIAQLDEMSYRRRLWDHRPITDFWRVGKGYASRLAANGMYTMGDVARCSVENEELLYMLFGVNAELLIDHAWGWEPCTMEAIKAYRPENSSLNSGQVLQQPYEFEKARLVVREMADMLALELVDKELTADQMVLTVGYDTENITDEERNRRYKGIVVKDRYGRRVPKEAHGSINLGRRTSSSRLIIEAVTELFERITDRELLVRRMYVTANHVRREDESGDEGPKQLDLFGDAEREERERAAENVELEREKRRQKAIIDIKKKYGRNALLKGMDLQEGATAARRNGQVGGHKA